MKKFLIIGIVSTSVYAEQAHFDNSDFYNKSIEKLQKYKEKTTENKKEFNKKLKSKIDKSNIPKVFFDGKIKTELVDIDNFGYPVYYQTTNQNSKTTINTDLIQSRSLSDIGSGTLFGVDYKLTGEGEYTFIWDGGIVNNKHVGFNNGRVDVKNNLHPNLYDFGWEHATHVAGTMVSNEFMVPSSRIFPGGMAPGAKLHSYDWEDNIHEIGLVSRAADGEAIVSNHSYGTSAGWVYGDINNDGELDMIWMGNPEIDDREDWKFGFYSQVTAELDEVAIDGYWHTIVKAAANDTGDQFYGLIADHYFTSDGQRHNVPCVNTNGGNVAACVDVPFVDGLSDNRNDYYDTLPTDSTAKNVLTVGSIKPLPFAMHHSNQIEVSSFSSVGPTDDSRIKPDVVANGENVNSLAYRDHISNQWNNHLYRSLDGTSMAAPSVSGSIALLHELYKKTNNNWENDGMTAMGIKALLIHTARREAKKGPNYKTGWGVVDISSAASIIASQYDGNNNINTKNFYQREIRHNGVWDRRYKADNGGNLTATLYWHDEPGEVKPPELNSRNSKLVVDLKLVIEEIEYRFGTWVVKNTWNPWKLNPIFPSNAATKGINHIDNVEQVQINNLTPGKIYRVRVQNDNNLLFPSRFGGEKWPFALVISSNKKLSDS